MIEKSINRKARHATVGNPLQGNKSWIAGEERFSFGRSRLIVEQVRRALQRVSITTILDKGQLTLHNIFNTGILSTETVLLWHLQGILPSENFNKYDSARLRQNICSMRSLLHPRGLKKWRCELVKNFSGIRGG